MVLDVFLCPADTVDQVVATSHRAIGVHHHIVGLFHIERRAVGHADDVDAFAHGVFVGHFVDNARARIKVIDGALHLVGVFEESFYFLSC